MRDGGIEVMAERKLVYVSESSVLEARSSYPVLRKLNGMSGFGIFSMLVASVIFSLLYVNSGALGFEIGSGYIWILGLLLFGYSVLVSGVVSVVVWGMMFLIGARESRLGYVDVLRFGILVASVVNLTSYLFWFEVVSLDFWYMFYIGLTSLILMFVVWSWNMYLLGIRYIERCEKSGYVLSDEEFEKRFGASSDLANSINSSNSSDVSSALSSESDQFVEDTRSEAEKRGYDVDENGFILPTEANRELANRDRREGIDVKNLANQVADYRNGSGDVIADASSPEGSNESTESIESENSERVEKSDEQK